MPDIETDYGAISIDTSIFDGHGLALESGLLKHLDQFKGSPVRVLISEIVERELRSHLRTKAAESIEQVEKALRMAQTNLQLSELERNAARDAVIGTKTADQVAEARFRDFTTRTGAEILTAEKVTGSDLAERYFEASPPFEENGKKKSEFPDAIALISLEKWAIENVTRVLVVSSDNGWEEFSKESDHVEVVGNLGDAFGTLNAHASSSLIVDQLSNTLNMSLTPDIYQAISDAIEESVTNSFFDVDADSSLHFEVEALGAELKDFTFAKDKNGKVEVNLVRVTSNEIVIQVPVTIEAIASADFSLSAWDSIDREYVGMGSNDARTEEVYEADLLITLTGKFSDGVDGLRATSVEVDGSLDYVHFGEVSFAHGYE